ncbi:MAG: hypothetical protein Q8K98_05405 [Bacteroidota bacterium]|nr:hypothetical protein [Bacteroidota bacterium]
MNEFPIFKESKTAKLSLLAIVFGTIFWLGAVHIRDVISNAILIMGTLEFKPNINPMVESAIMGLIAKSSMVVLGGYITVWIAGIVYLSNTRLVMKKNGWLLMSAILFYFFTPVEIYTGILDGRMIFEDLFAKGDLVEFRKLLIHRMAALAGAPRIAQFSYYTIIAIIIFQPFKKH